MSRWFYALLIVALISVIVVLISQNRHPVRTLAWIFILILLPGIGLFFYFLFGTDKRRERLISDEKLRTLKDKVAASQSEYVRSEVPFAHSDLASLLWMTNKSIPMDGNDVAVFTRFDDMCASLLEDISKATQHIHFEFFKFEDDSIGRKVGQLLIDKAREGVEVRVQYDYAANLFHAKFYKWLRSGGVHVKGFLPFVLPFLNSSSNYRNHRKVVVIDGAVGYLGGMNIAERYSKGVRRGRKMGVWRDTHIRVAGPSVADMQAAFLVDWQFSSKEFLSDDKYFPRVGREGDVTMQIATSGPMDEWNVNMQGMIRIITQAKKYVYLESPYLIPTEPVMLALRNAALSGVDVRIIIPYHGDRGVLTPYASRSFVADMLVAGIKIYFYTEGYMHSKTIVCDDTIATVGSTNLDIRSFEQDFELNAYIYDSSVAVILREAFLADEKLSSPVVLQSWEQRPRLQKFAESLARLFSPLL